MRRFFNMITVVAVSFGLSGCVSDYFIRKFMNGPDACKATEMNKVVDNRRALRNITNRLNRNYVLYAFGHKPDSTEKFETSDLKKYVVDSYQVSNSKLCGGTTDDVFFERVFYVNNRVVGKGDNFYDREVAPYKNDAQ